MLNLSTGLVKGQPAIVTEAKRDEYSMAFAVRHRKNWRKMQPQQQATVLRAGADQLEAWAAQMRNEAEELVR